MKILRVITSTNPTSGGPIEGIRQITPVLNNMGHVTEVASLDDPAAAWVADAPFIVHALGPGKTGYQYSPKLLPWLTKNASNYAAVIIHGLWQYGSYCAWQALHRTDQPYYVFTHGMLDPWFKRTYPLKHLKKMLYWPWAEYRVLRDAKAVLFTSEEERVLARQSFQPYQCREAVVAYGTARPSGDLQSCRDQFLAAYPQLRDRQYLLFLGRIHEKKGCDILIEAFAGVTQSMPDIRLVMAGPDQTGWRAALEQQAQSLGVSSRVTWTGMLSGPLKSGALAGADAFVLPSHQENFGIAVAEALAHGTPALISNKVNIWREVIGDQAGFAGADTLPGIKDLLSRWFNSSHVERLTMRWAALDCFDRRFEIHEAARSLVRVIEYNAFQPDTHSVPACTS